MLFQTNKKYESKLPNFFITDENERYYPIFETLLNIGIFHILIDVEVEDAILSRRFITHDLSHLMSIINNKDVESARIFYQFNHNHENDLESFQTLEVTTIEAIEKGLKLSFTNSKNHLDSYHKSNDFGMIYTKQ